MVTVPAFPLTLPVTLPVNAPVNVVADTLVNPASVVDDAPKLIAVVPIVTLLFTKYELAIGDPFQIPVAIVPTLVKLLFTTVEFSVVPVNVPAAAVTVISTDPSKLTPLIFRAVAKVVAVVALPVNAPTNVLAVNVLVLGLYVKVVVVSSMYSVFI